MKVDLSGKIAVVTGAGGVLARNFSLHLAANGAKVAALDINEAAVKETAQMICDAGGEAVGIRCDVLDVESVKAAEQAVRDAFGGYNLLINAAGGNKINAATSSGFFNRADMEDPGAISVFDISPEIYSAVLDLNLVGTFIPTQVFGKGLLEAENPNIINISSMTSYTALTKVLPYSNAKAAINSLTQWMAVHFGPVGIRVNAIAPGFLITHQNRAMLTLPDGSLSERSKAIIAHTPMGKMGEPDDLIGLLLFLCDETASGYITGTIIPVDGGFMAMPGV